MAYYRHSNGSILRVRCCCDDLCGCTPALPETLRMTIANVTDCGCVDAVVIDLVWDPLGPYWEGTGPGGGACAALSETFRLLCDDTVTPAGCDQYQLTMVGNTACNAVTTGPDACTCDPYTATFTLIVDGLGCCDGAMSGSGVFEVTIEEVP